MLRSFVGIISFLVFLGLLAWAGRIWVGEAQKRSQHRVGSFVVYK